MKAAIKSLLKPPYRLLKARFSDFKIRYWYQWFPAKPLVINMLANDICNSKCVMCNIWEQKRDVELSPEELEKQLKDPLYKKIRHVGITGGEPTMRKDLPELYDSVCKSLPSLLGVSIITNAIRVKDVIPRIEASIEVAKKYGKHFSIMVSLDGIGEVHDTMRGKSGNFDSALEVINYFKKFEDIPVTIGCTITKENVWSVNETLNFLIKNNIYGRFRIGEFIDRLYNNELKDEIRNFTSDEAYHLACFFKRLETEYETNPDYQRTYQSIQRMLLGEKREIGCPYKSHGVVVDCRGQLLYCAPKSDVIGNGQTESSWKLFKRNIKTRKSIIKDECNSCIHDYHAVPTYSEIRRIYKEAIWRKLLIPERKSLLKLRTFFIPKKKSTKKHVFITGWYGTETVGDKAILGGIVKEYKEKYGKDVIFTISSFHPFITYRTLAELEMTASVVDTYSKDFIVVSKSADIVVMGGGPLMDISSMQIPLAAFRLASSKAQKVIYGCGLGPLFIDRYEKMAKEMLSISTEIRLRDSKSVQLGKSWFPERAIELSGDPAAEFIKELSVPTPNSNKEYLGCYLREWSEEYIGQIPKNDFTKIRDQFELKLANQIKDICRKNNMTPHFYSMHTFCVGGDDRIFYDRFTKKYFSDVDFYIEESPSSVNQIISAMKGAKYNLCMRFHSVLFAEVLETKYFALDYTNGGKINGFLGDRNKLNQSVSLIEFVENEEAKVLLG